ncbi:unnamed protein product [Rhizopus stolonifer]
MYESLPSQKEFAALESLLQDSFNHALATRDLRPPTIWSLDLKGDNIDHSSDGLQLTYQGPEKEDVEASSIKANHSMKKQCGIYYFEIEIMSKGVDGHISIGFCMMVNSLDRLPGWEENSWGYYGHNGQISSGPGTEKAYGPHFTTGDIIGCGIDFRTMSSFYTKNGIHLGKAFSDIKDADLYPFVGFKTRGEQISTNFGSKPFKFDIEQHILAEKRNLVSAIASTEMNHDSMAAKNMADRLVLNYLRHHGYNDSANSLEKSMALFNQDQEPMEEDHVADLYYVRRQDIHQWILNDDIDSVIDICNQNYPNVLKENVYILFSLKCRKFLNMVQIAAASKRKPTAKEDEYEADRLTITHRDHATKRDHISAEMDPFKNKNKKQRLDGITELEHFRQVMIYGNELKKEYEEKAKKDTTIHDELSKTFSTLAYSDLSDPAVAYLFDTFEKENLAHKLDSAILVSLNRYPNSSIERLYQQTSTIIEELALGGNAKAALLEPSRDYLNIHHS